MIANLREHILVTKNRYENNFFEKNIILEFL